MHFAILLLLGVVFIAAVPKAQSSKQSDTLRSRITAVPVNVRVLDREGKPITNLKPTDFSILEDGVPQTVAHFSLQLVQIPENDRQSLNEAGEAPHSEEVDRVFLIVLGRGRLEGVAKGLSGAIQFVQHQLRPRDRIAILAYKRVTEFTTDRTLIARMLDRYRKDHGAIEAKLDHFFLNPEVRADIERLFSNSDLPAVRELPQPYPPSNVGQLYLGIEHLRAVPGEKHLIFISEDGINFGRRVTADLATRAAAEQIVISPIQTAGTPLRLRQPSARGSSTAVRQSARSFAQAFAYADLRNIARQTGGISSAYEFAEETLTRIANATSFQYGLSYYPTNSSWDGTERKIEVRVNRSGLTIQHRQSYTALKESAPADPTLILTRSRIAAAGESPLEIKGIKVRVESRDLTINNSDPRWAGQLVVAVFVDVSSLALQENDGQRAAFVDLAVFCGDNDKNVVGEVWERAELNAPVASQTRGQSEFEFVVRVPVERTPRYVKAVVYERTQDKLGSTVLVLNQERAR
jgi:VWFA-related protein